MQLYLDSFGAYLFIRDGAFAVRTKHAGERTFAVREVGAILLTKGTAMSADAGLLASASDIPVLLVDANTHFPLAQLVGIRSGSIATIRKHQALFSRDPAGLAWAARRTGAKVGRQRALLIQWAEQKYAPPGFAAEVRLADRILGPLQKALESWSPPSGTWDAAAREAAAQQIRGQEGTAARVYFQQLAKYGAGHLFEPFPGRQPRPAYDPLNALLNYLYGMLYTSVYLALLKSGLDPFMGILHADRYGDAPTLAFDAIEPYRPWADAVALALVCSDQVQPPWFAPDPEGHGLWLSALAKDAIIEAMLQALKTTTPFEGRNVQRGIQIDLEAQQLATLLKN